MRSATSLIQRFKIDPETTDGRSHGAEGIAVSAAVLEAFQQSGEFLHLGAYPLRTLVVIGWRGSRE